MRGYSQLQIANQIHPNINVNTESSQNSLFRTQFNGSNLFYTSSETSHISSTDTTKITSSFVFHMTEHRRCEPLCSCVCHQQRCLPSPQWLNNILGSLFLGYTGPPKYLNSCKIMDCQRSATTALCIQYIFPS